MAKHHTINSPRLNQIRRGKRRAFRKKVVLYFILLITLIIGSSFVSRIQKININNMFILLKNNEYGYFNKSNMNI